MLTFPHAKINLGLNVINKRADGYHDIVSCFYPIGWSDALEILPTKKANFTSSGLAIPGDASSNLCLKAYHLLRNEFKLGPVHIHLHKIIPMGAGLGGGSSDAAFTLKILNKIFELNLTEKKLMGFATQLGSDCPFFIQDDPVIATGTGNKFENITFSLKHYSLIIINPGLHVNTAGAYASLTPKVPEFNLKDILNLPITQWKDQLVNDFEAHVFKKFPEVATLKNKLYELGAVYASMTGSGSSVYGLFTKEPDIKGVFPANYFIWQQAL